MRDKIILLFIMLGLISFGLFYDYLEKRENDFNVCKRVLYEEDYIGKNCDRFFKNDKWYKDYMKIVDKNYQDLQKDVWEKDFTTSSESD